MPNETQPGLSVIKDPIPDAALPGADDGKYDFDFEYLKTTPDTKDQPPAPPVNGEGEKPTVPEPTVKTEPAPVAKPTEPGEQIVPDTPVIAVDASAEVTSLKAQLAEAQQKIAEMGNFVTVYDEFKKSPEKFIFKHVPALADKVSPDKLIMDKLKTEFGPDFRYDASDAFTEGTQSYDFRIKFEEMKDELGRERMIHQTRTMQEQEAIRIRSEESKKRVMLAYKLDEAGFKKEIEDFWKGKQLTFDDLAKLRFFNEHMASAVKKSNAQNSNRPKQEMPKSPAGVPAGADTTEVPEHLKEFHEVFGD